MAFDILGHKDKFKKINGQACQMLDVGIKACSRCGITKNRTGFSHNKSHKDGLQPQCKECDKKYYEKNRTRAIKLSKEYYAAHKENKKTSSGKWISSNRERWLELNKKNQRKRRKNPKYHLSGNISRRINGVLKGGFKDGRQWEKLVGYTVEQLKAHLEKSFLPGMTWENYGTVWEVDHKVPIAAFNFERPEDIDFRLCWSLKNLRPMQGNENKKRVLS